jgi:hypothetical protein
MNSNSAGNNYMNIGVSNRQKLYNAITAEMNEGFDGYTDDIESWTGDYGGVNTSTIQDQIYYLNNLTTVLHAMTPSRLNMPSTGWDVGQDENMYLHVDYICTMFYWEYSMFYYGGSAYWPASSICWQREFGLLNGQHPASPVVLGIENYIDSVTEWSNQTLAWQLSVVSQYVTQYGAPNLVGFGLFSYEFMAGASAPTQHDWADWNAWITGQTSTSTSTSASTSTQITQTQGAYGAISVSGVLNNQNVAFEAWIDGGAHVQVPSSGYTFENLLVGDYVLYALFNGTTWSTIVRVINAETAVMSFDFNIPPQSIMTSLYLPAIAIALTAFALFLPFRKRR